MEALDFKIMGRDFRVACKPDEVAALQQAVNIVETRMSAIRNTGKVVGLDKIAVMAALQIAHDSIAGNSSDKPILGLDIGVLEGKIGDIEKVLDGALADSKPTPKTGSLFD